MAHNNRYESPIKLDTKKKILVIDGQERITQTVIVHRFSVGDVEDPVLYAAFPIREWETSEVGKWVIEHTVEPLNWHRHHNMYSYGYDFIITAQLTDEDYTFFKLKYE